MRLSLMSANAALAYIETTSMPESEWAMHWRLDVLDEFEAEEADGHLECKRQS